MTDNMQIIYRDFNVGFDFKPPSPDELYVHIINSDVDVSSCIDGNNAKICKMVIHELPQLFVNYLLIP